MESTRGSNLKLNADEIKDAIISFLFKKRPELRPSGVSVTDPKPQVYFTVDNMDIAAVIVMPDVEKEDIEK